MAERRHHDDLRCGRSIARLVLVLLSRSSRYRDCRLEEQDRYVFMRITVREEHCGVDHYSRVTVKVERCSGKSSFANNFEHDDILYATCMCDLQTRAFLCQCEFERAPLLENVVGNEAFMFGFRVVNPFCWTLCHDSGKAVLFGKASKGSMLFPSPAAGRPASTLAGNLGTYGLLYVSKT